jgi:hypothetical protein
MNHYHKHSENHTVFFFNVKRVMDTDKSEASIMSFNWEFSLPLTQKKLLGPWVHSVAQQIMGENLL